MSDTATVGDPEGLPRSLRATSLWKRSIVGMLVLIIGVLTAAWIFDASIEKPSARFAVPGLSASQTEHDAR